MPLISVIVPLYNKADYIGETIRSVQAQSVADWEMLVVDNGSTDGGAHVARACPDPRVHVLTSPAKDPVPPATTASGWRRASGFSFSMPMIGWPPTSSNNNSPSPPNTRKP